MSGSSEEVGARVRAAMLRLLDEKPYHRISFKELAAETGMSRQNLYYYYKSKENVLEEIIEDFFDDIYNTMMRYSPVNIGAAGEEDVSRELVRATLIAIRDNDHVTRLLFDEEMSALALEKQVAFLKRMLGSVIRARNIKVNDPKFIHYLALQISGASYQVVREWLLVDRDFPVERIVELGQPLLLQVISSLENN